MKTAVRHTLSSRIAPAFAALVAGFSLAASAPASAAVLDPAAAAQAAKDAAALHRNHDDVNALKKIKAAIEGLPIPYFYETESVILTDLHRYPEALESINFAVNNPFGDEDLFGALIRRSVIRHLMLDYSGSTEDARRAQKMTPAKPEPNLMWQLNMLLSAGSPLGAVWKLDNGVKEREGSIVEVLVLKPDGHMALHEQKVRKDGSFTQMLPDDVWPGDTFTVSGVFAVLDTRWNMATFKPEEITLKGTFEMSIDGSQLVLTHNGEQKRYTRLLTFVKSIDNLPSAPPQKASTPAASKGASSKDDSIDLPALIRQAQEIFPMK